MRFNPSMMARRLKWLQWFSRTKNVNLDLKESKGRKQMRNIDFKT